MNNPQGPPGVCQIREDDMNDAEKKASLEALTTILKEIEHGRVESLVVVLGLKEGVVRKHHFGLVLYRGIVILLDIADRARRRLRGDCLPGSD